MRVAAGAMCLTAALFLPAAASAQGFGTGDARVSRESLTTLLTRYELAAQSPAYSPVLRTEALDQAQQIRNRLEQGDFRAGDRLLLTVEEYAELTDTFSVAADQKLALPGVGEVDLKGVLRSEIQQKVSDAVALIIREPRVRTRALVRVLVDGAVANPGYYVVDSDVPISDLLMRAGGQDSEARLEAARVDRSGETVVTPEQFSQALRTGATIDQVGMADGDRLLIPGSRTDWVGTARDLTYIIPAAVGIVTLIL